MARCSAAVLAILLTIYAAGGAAAQETKAATDKPPATNNTSGMTGDKAKNAESAPHGPATAARARRSWSRAHRIAPAASQARGRDRCARYSGPSVLCQLWCCRRPGRS
jgi:hypothetical protein